MNLRRNQILWCRWPAFVSKIILSQSDYWEDELEQIIFDRNHFFLSVRLTYEQSLTETFEFQQNRSLLQLINKHHHQVRNRLQRESC